MPESKRGRTLTIFAILFGILAISNLLKPLQIGGEQTGFVFFGVRLSGLWNTIVGPLFGVFLAVYAWGIWNMRRFAMPMAHFYATYVVLNLILFTMIQPEPESTAFKIFSLVYAAVAIGVSVGAAIELTRRKNELR